MEGIGPALVKIAFSHFSRIVSTGDGWRLQAAGAMLTSLVQSVVSSALHT
jgi:hypothetical protein